MLPLVGIKSSDLTIQQKQPNSGKTDEYVYLPNTPEVTFFSTNYFYETFTIIMPPNKIWGIIKSDHPSVRLSVSPLVCLFLRSKNFFFLKGMPFKLHLLGAFVSRTVTQFLFLF